jgi:translation initiation factor 2D
LRSSDRRKTADQIIKDLDLSLKAPVSDAASAEEKAASTAELSALRNSLLPDNSLSARFTTTHGPDLKLVSGTVYVGSHNGDEQRVLWAKINDRMYPTVYTLWSNPGILPLLHTGSFVVEKLRGGADLMTPGLYGGPPFPANATKGSIVAVSSAENPSVPLVVGYCEIDVSALRQVQGTKGHAVRTIHWSGDELWSWSANGNPGTTPPERLEGWLEKDVDLDELDRRTEQLDLKRDEGEEDGGVSLGADRKAPTNNSQNLEEREEEEESREMTTKGRLISSNLVKISLTTRRNRRRLPQCLSLRYSRSQNYKFQ